MHYLEANALRRHGQIRDEDGLTLRVEGPVMRLQGPGEDRLLVTDPVPGARFYKARIEGITEARMAGRGWEWDCGYTLRPHLSCDYRPRDWAWAWSRTYGPVILNIYLPRTVAEWEEWLAGMAPHGYTQDAQMGRYKWGDSRLSLRPGSVQFARSYITPPAAVQWVDAGLLGSLLGQEHLAWDLMDGDYRSWVATGHTAASLANYLRADGSEDRGDLPRHTVEAGTLRDEPAIAEAIATSFGLPAGTDILAWIRETPVPALPRTVTVNLPRDLSQMYETSPLLQGLVLANMRVFWSFSFGG
jgi:hypothetical protein